MLTALYTATQAHQAAVARRHRRWDDPELKKLGQLSLSLDLDLQRIYLQTEVCAEYINLTRDYVAAQDERKNPGGSEALSALHDKLDSLWKRLSPQEERALQSMNLYWFVKNPDADYSVLAEIPPMFRSLHRTQVGKDDPFHPITLKIFEEDNFSSSRSPAETRAITLIHRAYTIMSCNDPGQRLVGQLKTFLQDFGVPFEDQQVFQGKDD